MVCLRNISVDTLIKKIPRTMMMRMMMLIIINNNNNKLNLHNFVVIFDFTNGLAVYM
jgi:hypothetical protein